MAFYLDKSRAAISFWESPNRSPTSAKHVQGSCYLHSPLPAASLRTLIWPVSYQRLLVIESTFISAPVSISYKMWAVCFLMSSSLCWCHQCAGGSMSPVLPLSSVEVLVLHDAGSWGQCAWNQSVKLCLQFPLILNQSNISQQICKLPVRMQINCFCTAIMFLIPCR